MYKNYGDDQIYMRCSACDVGENVSILISDMLKKKSFFFLHGIKLKNLIRYKAENNFV